jgi:Ca-activated chloride channel family protein
MPLGAAEQERIASEQYNQMQSAPPAAVSGATAVQKAADQGAMAGAEAPAPVQQSSGQVRVVGARTFVFSNDQWVDTGFDPQTMQTIKVAFLSGDYFDLANARPDLAAAFALGQNVIALSEGQAYEVVPSGTSTQPIEIPATVTPVDVNPATPASTQTAPSISTPTDPPTPVPSPASPCASAALALILIPLGIVFRRSRHDRR